MVVYLTFAFFSTFKFMFTPLAGPLAGLNFIETYISCLVGGLTSVSLFYYLGNTISAVNQRILAKRIEKALNKNRTVKLRKRFTKTNRSIIKLKNKLNFFMACWLIPLFFSLPIGSIVIAKFYRHKKEAFLYIVIGVILNCTAITTGTYLFYHFIK